MTKKRAVPTMATNNQIDAAYPVLKDRPLTTDARLKRAVADVYEAMVAIAPPEHTGGLTKRQARMMEAIKDHIDDEGQAPTRLEISTQTGVDASNVCRMLRQIERRGYIRLMPGWRGIEIIKRSDEPTIK